MREIVPQRIDNRQIKWLVVVMFGGAGCGMMLVALFLRLKATYATFLCAGMMLPLALISVGNSKRLLIAMLATLMPISVDTTINHAGFPVDIAGYIVSLYDGVLLVLYVMWFGEIAHERRERRIRFFPVISIPAILLILVGWLSMVGAERQDLSLYEAAGVTLEGADRVPRYNPETMETDVPGLYLAGTTAAGRQGRYTLFIENTHQHVLKIVAAITGRSDVPIGTIPARTYDLLLSDIEDN